ncbi:hypothetical protein AC578_9898 [Pseudocercospora eumusae]|uniref:Tyrosinase copper-binding domain-containing protein n=1 Tax=Pseudocercospora eumusae TaxID=321146 RepID=A0A139HAY5_9PEZI|nr:hypothetical protein AC578_9898 [Pseudocercospora eumusae]
MRQAFRKHQHSGRPSCLEQNSPDDSPLAHLLGGAIIPTSRFKHRNVILSPSKERSRISLLAWALVAGFAGLAVVYFAVKAAATAMHIDRAESSASLCRQGRPYVRREWRTLSHTEKQSYISAVRCLRTTPSSIHNRNGVSRFDDFAWTHENVGQIAHEAAAFLSWHRAFIAEFEEDLRRHCAYNGSLPYWDWSLDWQHPTKSPVFDPESGFGGNGEPSMPSPKSDGWCLTEGPFAGAMIPFHGKDWTPHCLARKFTNGSTFDGHALRPYYLREVVLEHDDYFDMLMSLERGPHNAIPRGINGVFKSFLAPADPLFWLHHCQLDRVWWIWQRNQSQRQLAYSGPSFHATPDRNASLSDTLNFDGLMGDVAVVDVITTTAGMLCYEYDSVRIGEL